MVLRLDSNPRNKALAGELVECWWNGRFGLDHRHDLWLKRFGITWCVESRHGGSGGQRQRDYYSDEMSARAHLAALKTEHGDSWKWVPFG
ncbi:hypothetical protein Rhe02_95680 [Rhizocola hellebori]|uniref:Uncharacterized protein n=1 Tax=Rhizocola hellebori TaxID=1392758 RepID=A0A8J3VMN3_9ACTN|nr:hypothetical protein [Rhizocola hellebori]GIH11501.1 hypothetical protein Rhe02_95680 [Rhizocola hellebori]